MMSFFLFTFLVSSFASEKFEVVLDVDTLKALNVSSNITSDTKNLYVLEIRDPLVRGQPPRLDLLLYIRREKRNFVLLQVMHPRVTKEKIVSKNKGILGGRIPKVLYLDQLGGNPKIIQTFELPDRFHGEMRIVTEEYWDRRNYRQHSSDKNEFFVLRDYRKRKARPACAPAYL